MSKKVFKYSEKVRYKNTGNPAIVCLCTEKSVLVQTPDKEFWVRYEEISLADDPNDPGFADIKIPPSHVVLDIQSDVDQTVMEYADKYRITAKDKERLKDSLMGAVMRKQLLQARDGYFDEYTQ